LRGKTVQLHQRPKRSKAQNSDEYETPTDVFESICKQHRIVPDLDVCAEYGQNKCAKFYSPEEDGLVNKWKWDVWCNPPHNRRTKDWVLKADEEWQKNNINILMFVPANAICARYFDDVFEKGHAKYYRYSGRPTFWVKGKPAKDSARNSYFVVIWRKV